MALNLDKCIEQLLHCELLSEATIKEVTEKVKELLIYESNVEIIKGPLTVVGDIHGQLYDLLEIFKIGGKFPDTNYLFLGNYVDRGYYSVETISLLACLKLRYPSRITLLRGNHECRQITKVYGFYGECVRKYGNANVWRYFTDMFDYLTIAAVVNNDVFCVHGGLSPSISTLDQIRVLDRFKEIGGDGPLCDLLWSDVSETETGFGPSPRNVGCSFGQDVVNKFTSMNKLKNILRSNQLCMDGYQELFDGKVSTIWSAPNFGQRCNNVGSILEISDTQKRYFNTFTSAPDSFRQKPTADVTKEVPDYFL